MPLKDIFCQEKAITDLQLAFAGDKVAHAFIFAGHDGVGKFTTAREFAKLLLCKNPVERGRLHRQLRQLRFLPGV